MTALRRLVLCGLAAALPTACTTGAGVTPSADLCAFQVSDASAWINRMPTIGQQPGAQLIVQAQVTPVQPVRSLALISDDGPVLRLTVRPGAAPLTPGVLGWRMYAPETPFERVEISCNGAVKTVISSIDTVY